MRPCRTNYWTRFPGERPLVSLSVSHQAPRDGILNFFRKTASTGTSCTCLSTLCMCACRSTKAKAQQSSPTRQVSFCVDDSDQVRQVAKTHPFRPFRQIPLPERTLCSLSLTLRAKNRLKVSPLPFFVQLFFSFFFGVFSRSAPCVSPADAVNWCEVLGYYKYPGVATLVGNRF